MAQPLDQTLRVYIAVPPDGGYAGKPSPGSGAQAANGLASEFAKRGIPVDVGSEAETRDQAIASADKQAAGYAVVPTVLNWEHRATAWSAIPSKLSMRVDVWDARTGAKLDSTVLESQSAALTFLSTGPEMLLQGSIAAYVASLYGDRPATKAAAAQ
ncbi:hypothetical protein D3C71_1506200 [compost metagenome]